MFSTVCDVYAPMYRQVTFNGNQSSYNASVETAYQSAKSAFEDFLDNYNGDRGFMMLGHSQGAVHGARLIAELIDSDPKLRKRFVGAIVPGANIAVPIGESVGGLFDEVPACTEVGQLGCVIAFPTFKHHDTARTPGSRGLTPATGSIPSRALPATSSRSCARTRRCWTAATGISSRW